MPELRAIPNLEELMRQAKTLLDDFRKKKLPAVEKFDALELNARPKVADAQRAVAREYGFDDWNELKKHVETMTNVVRDARQALRKDDPDAFRDLLDRNPAFKSRINEPLCDFHSPLINGVRSEKMLDVLLDAGADINNRSHWEPGSFGLLDSAPPEVARYAIRRGAVLTVHAAARLGMLDEFKDLIAADPQLVHARGGDGQTPLHFASTIEIAEYLLDHGADIDARDVDHESTAAQYMVRNRQEIARYLIGRGCKTDLLMAAALGDTDLAERLLQADPECIRTRVSSEYFPMIGEGDAKGGTIYQWELGWYVSAPQVAKKFGHTELFEMLMARSPAEEKLLNACWMHDESMVRSLLAENPTLADALPPAGRRHVAHAARNNDTIAAGLMLEAGLPVVGQYSQHHATALHWTGFNGNAELARLILKYNPPLEDADNQYQGTPLNWAMYGSVNGWHPEQGDYAGVVEALLDAGARMPKQVSGSKAVRAVLRKRRAK